MSMTVSKTIASNLNPSFHMPEDVVIEILSRLPVKSLIRFTVVCKAWHALIENPIFISKHFKQNPNPDFNYLLVSSIPILENSPFHDCCTFNYSMSLQTGNGFDTPINLDFPFLGERNNLSVVGACNSLVCISLSLNKLDLVICNPSTRRFRKIPSSHVLDASGLHNEESTYGFTFDPCCDDYKLINITCTIHNQHREKAGIYTMSTDSWREIDIAPIDDNLWVHGYSASALIGSVFYWKCYTKPSLNAVLLCFNMVDESFKVISCPHQGFDWLWNYGKSFQLEEELAIFVITGNRYFIVWTLNADSNVWNVRYSIKRIPEFVIPGFIEGIGDIKLVGPGKNADVICEDRKPIGVKLFCYDLESREVKMLPLSKLGCNYQVIGYTESLIQVKKSNQV